MKNILYQESIVEIKHLFHFMKNTVLALFVFAGTAFASESYSQTMKVTFVADNISTGKIINEIEKQTDYLFVYNENEVNMGRNVKVHAQNTPVAEVLNKIFEGTGIYYAMEGKNIMLMSKANDAVRQENRIKGIVKDVDGEPVIGANVTVKGQTIGTITDIDGQFMLDAPTNAVLQITYIGYMSQEVKVSGKKELIVILKEDAETLDEVVVVGYGTMKKRDITGSVSSVNSSVLTASSAPSAADALQGRIAGVNIQKNAGRPGGSYSIQVRGVSSIKNKNSGPLYVIDGIPTTEGMNDLNPSDIETIDVLKDASATAIYGSRGANGVVIVTTKRGEKGKVAIQYEGNVGFKEASHLPEMMNGDEYVQFRTDLYHQLGRSTDRSNAEFFTAEEWDRIDRGAYTNWIDLVLRKGFQTSNTITASGGDDKGTFSIGLGQLNENGTIEGQDYDRYNMHLNINRKFSDKWEAGGSLYFTYSIQNEGSYETLRSAFRLPPVSVPYDTDGNMLYRVFRNDNVTNPLFESTEDGEWRENKRFRAFGNIYLKFEPLKGLAFRTQLSPQMLNKRNGEYYGLWCKNGGGGSTENTSAVYSTNNHWGYVWDNQATYDKRFGKHNLNVNLVQSIQYQQWESSYQKARNLPYNSKWYNLDAVASTDIMASQTDYQQTSLASFLGRIQYSFMDKYLFTVSGRYDGSSRLADGNKWAFFPSAAFAWMLGEEDFIKKIDFISNLKLRLSYGVTGNDAVSIYGTQSNVSNRNYDFGGNVSTSYYKNGLANTKLTWERTQEINVGLDFGFFRNRINGSLDVYQRTSKDLIMERQLPSTTGWTSVWDNIGKVRNTGIELSINTTNIQTDDFSWQTNVIFDTNKNEILELYGGKKDDIGNKWFIGEAINVNYDYEFDGIWQTQEADKAAVYGQTPGQVKVKDQNDDGVIDANDKVVIGQQLPKWTGSITNTFTYKKWDLAFNIYTRQGAQLNSTFVSSFMAYDGNYKQAKANYWTETNPSNEFPQPGNKGKYFSAMSYQDVSFVRVGYITLGYTFPSSILTPAGIKRLKVYATANNPFLFTSFPGFDPEWATQNTWGDVTSTRTFLFGVKLEF